MSMFYIFPTLVIALGKFVHPGDDRVKSWNFRQCFYSENKWKFDFLYENFCKIFKILPKIVKNIPTHVLQHLWTIFGGILYILQKFSYKKSLIFNVDTLSKISTFYSSISGVDQLSQNCN